MRQSLFTSKISKTLLIATAATLAFGRMGVLNAAVVQSNSPTVAADTMIAFDNACADDELLQGDEVTIEGADYSLEEDADGLFISVEGETYSLVSFDSDCETVNFQQIDGVDTLSGSDVDEDEADAADADMEEGYEEADADMEEGYEEADADMEEGYEEADADMEEDYEEADADMEEDYEEADADMEEDYEEADADMEEDMEEETADADVEEE
jgi:hypothetical protein